MISNPKCLCYFLFFTLTGCVINVDYGGYPGNDSFGNVDAVFGDIRVQAERSAGNLSTVNGSAFVGKLAQTGNVDVVNGNIDIDTGASSQSLSTVNGNITAGKDVTVRHAVSTVNGDIKVSTGSHIHGDVTSVNGDIEIRMSRIGGNIENFNGDIVLRGIGKLEGDIIIKDNDKNEWKTSSPKLHIDNDFTIQGNIILHKSVKLNIENGELRARVQHLYD